MVSEEGVVGHRVGDAVFLKIFKPSNSILFPLLSCKFIFQMTGLLPSAKSLPWLPAAQLLSPLLWWLLYVGSTPGRLAQGRQPLELPFLSPSQAPQVEHNCTLISLYSSANLPLLLQMPPYFKEMLLHCSGNTLILSLFHMLMLWFIAAVLDRIT